MCKHPTFLGLSNQCFFQTPGAARTCIVRYTKVRSQYSFRRVLLIGGLWLRPPNVRLASGLHTYLLRGRGNQLSKQSGDQGSYLQLSSINFLAKLAFLLLLRPYKHTSQHLFLYSSQTFFLYWLSSSAMLAESLSKDSSNSQKHGKSYFENYLLCLLPEMFWLLVSIQQYLFAFDISV